MNPKNTTACGGPNNILDGCGMIFPRWPTGSDLCALCKKLKGTELSKEEIVQIQNKVTQCDICGLCGSTVRNPCGTCLRLDAAERNLPAPNAEAAQNRRNLLDGRLGKTSVNVPPPGPSTPEAELTALRTNTGAPGNFSISHEVRLSNKAGSVDKVLGKGCYCYSENLTMHELQQQIVDRVNPVWTANNHSFSLQISDTELRAKGNLMIDAAHMVFTIRAWYNYHNTTQLREVYLQSATGIVKNPKGGSFHLELFVYLDRYMARTQEGATGSTFGNEIANTSSLKRRAHDISGGKAKRSRGPSGTVLTSQFAPTNTLANLPIPQITTTITFRHTNCSVDDNGDSFLTENDVMETGSLDRTEIQLPSGVRGRTKTIYGLTIANRPYIAKKLVNIGDGLVIGGVEPNVAAKYLTTDLIRLAQMRYFADSFLKYANEKGVELAPFHVSDGFLIKTYSGNIVPPPVPEEPEPEPVMERFNAVYLVEPRRTSFAVLKFSGTLGTLNNIDQKTATMSAFSHYVLERSACVFMFSDIQGTMEPSATGFKLVLFDPMTHTRTGKSGLGDHGLTGIKDFINNHECSPICRQLMLCSIEDLETTFKTLDDADSDSNSDSESI